MSDIAALVGNNLDIWTSATQRKSSAGRGGGKRISLYGLERLRALILDLAVRGKLVPRDAGDEPAAELLKQIKSARTKLIASGEAKKNRPLNLPGDPPFSIPGTWAWSQLGEVTNYGETDKADPGSVPPDTWVLELEDVEKGTSRLLERVLCSDREFQSQKNKFQPGDVIYGKLRPYLDKVIIADQAGVCTTEMVPIRGYGELRSDYIRLFLKTPFFISLATEAAHGMNLPRLATEKAREAPIPLPPLADQDRIVAKVDVLMALCDALERESANAMAAHQELVEELLATLVKSADAADLAINWGRLATHFDVLFITDASIDALKQTILNLAVSGKLVEQDAGDEGASVLLNRIQAERSKMLGARQASKISASIKGKHNLPLGWEWTPLARLGLAMTGGTPRSSRPENFDGLIPFIGPGQISPDGDILPAEKFISDLGLNQSTEAIAGDVLMVCIGGSIGKSGIIRERMAYNQQINAIRPLIADSKFVDLYLRCSRFQSEVLDRATGSATPIINRGKWETIPVAVPPLAEQHRIVSKVDALMALCDVLKARIIDAAQTQRYLADAITEQAAA